MDNESGMPGEVTQGSTFCSPSSFCSRNFWKGTHLELLEVPSGPRWKGGRGLGPNRVGGGDQTPDHSTCEEAHPEEARRLITTFPPLPLTLPPPHHPSPFMDNQSKFKWCFKGRNYDSSSSHLPNTLWEENSSTFIIRILDQPVGTLGQWQLLTNESPASKNF